jgi:uncharacterized peroxidase-related enzyme
MSYLHQVPIDEAEYPPFTAVRKEFGFIPNFFRAQTARRDLIEAELGLVEAILVREGALSRRLKEYVFLVCSASNLSTYCVTAHCEIVRMLGIKGPEPEEIAIDHRGADIPPADKALLDFARTLSLRPTTVGQKDIDHLRGLGFSDQQIMEAVVMVGLAKFGNYIAFGLGTVPDFDNPRADMQAR